MNDQVRTSLARDGGAWTGFAGFLALTEGLGASSAPQGRTWRRADLHERVRQED